MNGLVVFSHVFVAAPSVVVENGVFSIKFDCFGELQAGLVVILKFVINDSKSIVNWRESGVVFEELTETVKGVLVLCLPFVVEPQVIKAIDIFGLEL